MPTFIRPLHLGGALAALALAACQQQPPVNEADANMTATENVAAIEDDTLSTIANSGAAEQAPVPAALPGNTADGETVGGDGSAITLSALTEADINGAKLAGELACSFARTGGHADTLLLAKGNAGSKDPAVGLVKIGDYVETVRAPGGFDGMLRGATFNARGTTVRITPSGEAKGGGESPPRPADLLVQRADGASRTFPGTWTCGP